MKQIISNTYSFIKTVFGSTADTEVVDDIADRYRTPELTAAEDSIIGLIGKKDYEQVAVVAATNLDIACNSLPIQNFVVDPQVRSFLSISKSRYWELFISLCGPRNRNEFSSRLYSKHSKLAVTVRTKLLLPSLVSADVPPPLFETGVREWQIMFGTDIVPLTKDELMKNYTKDAVRTNKKLFDTINTLTPYYFFRKLVFQSIPPFIMLEEILKDHFSDGRLSCLDYGCGTGEFSIYLAQRGHDVTICDIEGDYLEAVKKRFEFRNLPVRAIGATPDIPIPDLGNNFDIVIAREVLEHIRHPARLLATIDSAVRRNGCIILGSFPFTSTAAKGDHLEEAVFEQNNLLKWINERWDRLPLSAGGNVFTKNRRMDSN